MRRRNRKPIDESSIEYRRAYETEVLRGRLRRLLDKHLGRDRKELQNLCRKYGINYFATLIDHEQLTIQDLAGLGLAANKRVVISFRDIPEDKHD